MQDTTLLTRTEFREKVFDRDKNICVVPNCDKRGVDAHHIIERKLWSDGGYYLCNGATVCEEHHKLAERDKIFPQSLREWIGTKNLRLPVSLDGTKDYTKWGKVLTCENVPYKKYNSTMYLPFSPRPKEHTRDVGNIKDLLNCPLVITIKMDGSNFKANRKIVTARNGYAANHVSFDMLKRYHATFSYKIPKDLDIFGEWLYAKHSVPYVKELALKDYCQVFAIYNSVTHMWSSWEGVQKFTNHLDLITVPVLTFARYGTEWQLIKSITEIANKVIKQGHEGIVVRNISPFHNAHFTKNVMKYVREDHVQTDEHWSSREVIKNELLEKG